MEAKVFLLWGNDEILIGTVDEVLRGYVNFKALLEDIVADMVLENEDETTIKLVIK